MLKLDETFLKGWNLIPVLLLIDIEDNYTIPDEPRKSI